MIAQQLFLADTRDAGVKPIATSSGVEFDPADADPEYVSTFLTAVSGKESQNASRRMVSLQQAKAQRGEADGGHRGFGQTRDRTELVKEEARVRREAARRLMGGESMRSIVLDSQGQGITTMTGTQWTVPSRDDLMRQPRLMGKREHHGTLYDTKWAVILDAETWEHVQAISAARKAGPKRRAARSHLLTGHMHCSLCGARMKGGQKEGAPR